MPERMIRHRLLVRVLVPFIRALLFFVMLVLGPLRTHGKKNIPRSGGLIVVANHIADIDPIIAQAACPRLIHFMAKSELWDMGPLGPIIDFFHAFPVQRDKPDLAAYRHALRLLQAGEVVCVFPEGRLSKDGKLQPLLEGFAAIAIKSGVPVIALGLEHTNRVLPFGSLIPRPSGRILRARWGCPRSFTREDNPKEALEWCRQELLRLTGQAQDPNVV